jgi:hypothetical protein
MPFGSTEGWIDPLSGLSVPLSHQDQQAGKFTFWGAVFLGSSLFGSKAPMPSKLGGKAWAGIALAQMKEATKDLPPFLSLLPPIPFVAPTFAQLLEAAMLQYSVFPTGLPRAPAEPVAIPWGKALELLKEGARLQDNVLPEGLNLPAPFIFDDPVGPGPMFAASTATATDIDSGGRASLTVGRFGYINAAHSAVNALTISLSSTGAFSVNANGTITNVFGKQVGETAIPGSVSPNAQGGAVVSTPTESGPGMGAPQS